MCICAMPKHHRKHRSRSRSRSHRRHSSDEVLKELKNIQKRLDSLENANRKLPDTSTVGAVNNNNDVQACSDGSISSCSLQADCSVAKSEDLEWIDQDDDEYEDSNDIEQTMNNQMEITNPENSALPEQTQATNELQEEVLTLLGVDVTKQELGGPAIQKDLASRWTAILKSGISEEERQKLLSKHLIPENCPLLAPPKMNKVVANAISDSVTRRDNRIATQQAQLGAAISAIGDVITLLLKKEGGGNLGPIEALSDAGRLLSDLHHRDSTARRELASHDLNKNLKDTLHNVTGDVWLFGEDLEERVKASKSLERSSLDLKPTRMKNVKQQSPSKSLNSRSLPRSLPQGVRLGRRQTAHLPRGQATNQQSQRGYRRMGPTTKPYTNREKYSRQR